MWKCNFGKINPAVSIYQTDEIKPHCWPPYEGRAEGWHAPQTLSLQAWPSLDADEEGKIAILYHRHPNKDTGEFPPHTDTTKVSKDSLNQKIYYKCI